MLILAIVGGYMTGLFAGYLFDLIKRRFGRMLTILLSLLFYIVPVWALLSILSSDGLLFFYVLLLVFYFMGVRDSKLPAVNDDKADKDYEPYD